MAGISATPGNQTYDIKTKETSGNSNASNTSSADKTAQQGVSVFTSSLIEGKGLDGAINATNQLIQQSVQGALKSAATKFLTMLLGGNDSAQASADSATTAAHIGNGTKTLSVLQEKLINANLQALEQLVTTGNMDIQTYAQQLTQIAVSVGTQGEEATAFSEEQQKLQDRNKEIEQKLAELGVNISRDDKSGEVVIKDKDGKEVVVKQDKNNSKDSTGGSDDVNALIQEYQSNCSMIQTLGKQINDTVAVQEKVSEHLSQGITDIAIKGQDLGTVVVNQATQLINEGLTEITDEVMKQVGTLQGDAVTGYTNAAVDSGAAAAAPGLAAAETVGTFGFGAGHAATIVANGVADGVAAGVRTATGSSAVGGIAAGLAAGKGLGQVVASTLASEAQNWVQGQVNDLTNSMKESLLQNKTNVDTQSQDLQNANLVKEDDKKS